MFFSFEVDMSVKVGGFFLITLLVGSYALPFKSDVSIFFDHSDTDIGVDADLSEDTVASARIVGGSIAGSVPHMVALTFGIITRNLLCGGSLITTKHVMSAAHCIDAVVFDNNLLSSIRGHVGTNRYASGGTSYVFSSHVIHPNYISRTLKNDIGFLITSKNVALSSSVALVPLSFDFIDAGVPTVVNGWGSIYFGSNMSEVLLELRSSIYDAERCVTRVAERAAELNLRGIPHVDPNIEICNFRQQGKGNCHGDSGSALLRSDRNQQIGIVSWGLSCALNAPDIFVRVSAYRSWIVENTR